MGSAKGPRGRKNQEKFEMITTTKLSRTALLAAGAVMLTVAPAIAAKRAPGIARPRQPARAQLEVGQPAPDFELPSLTFQKSETGEMVGRISEKKVKLSAFRGRAPVCIFSSSYT
jgi:hypothetical protein